VNTADLSHAISIHPSIYPYKRFVREGFTIVITPFPVAMATNCSVRTPHLRVCENRVLRIICGLKRDEVTGGWRKPHIEELRDLYSSPSVIRMIKSRRMRWAGHVARMGEKRNAYRLLVGKPEGKRPLGT
jgi:hypothetical protein